MELILSFNRSLGMTVLMVTHEQALAEKYAGRMVHLADGRLVDDVSNYDATNVAGTGGDNLRFGSSEQLPGTTGETA